MVASAPDSRWDLGSAPRGAWRWIPWLFGAALVAAVIVGAYHFSEAREFARLTEQAEPWWFLLALMLQAGTYLAQGQVYRVVARKSGASLNLGAAARLSLMKLFVDQAVPTAGLSGTVVLAEALRKGGMPRPVVAAAIVVDLASFYAAYVLSLAVALAIATARGETSTILVLVTLVFFLFAIGLSVFVLALSGRATRTLPKRVVRFRPLRIALDFVREADPHLVRSRRVLFAASAYQLAIVLCDATTVWVLLRSLGTAASPGGVFASFMVSSLLRTIGFMPGGLGTFEATSVLTLKLVGVPVAPALASTLLFRGLSFWLPMLPGLWISRRTMQRPSREASAHVRPDAPLEKLTSELGTSSEGLTTVEALRRLEVSLRAPAASTLRSKLGFLRTSLNPLVVILLVAGAASAFLGEVTDAVLIGVIVSLSAGINFWQTFRSDRAVKRLQERVAPTATVRRDGAWVEVPRGQVVVGDVVRLSAGDLVPADARLVEASDLHVHQAALTGESLPAEKSSTAGALASTGPDSAGLVFLGTSIVSGTATAIVFASGRDTAFGDIVERLAARPEETEFERGSAPVRDAHPPDRPLPRALHPGGEPEPRAQRAAVAALLGGARGRAHARVSADDHHRDASRRAPSGWRARR